MSDLPDGETIEVKRRRLRAAIRQYRLDAGRTQKQAADELGWSISKIVRVEQGAVPIAPSDVRAMLHLYGEADAERMERLVGLAKAAREQKGFAEYSDIASQEYQELLGLERSAKVVYKYEPSVVPGIFQTYDYARALSRALGSSERTIERQVELRMQRQLLLEAARRPELNFILGEASVARPVGGVDVMNEQLNRLLELSAEDGVNLWLLPFAAGPHRGMGSAFTIMEFEDPQLPDLLYLENAERESISRDEKVQIKYYEELFVQLQALATEHGSFEEQLETIRRERFGTPPAG